MKKLNLLFLALLVSTIMFGQSYKVNICGDVIKPNSVGQFTPVSVMVYSNQNFMDTLYANPNANGHYCVDVIVPSDSGYSNVYVIAQTNCKIDYLTETVNVGVTSDTTINVPLLECKENLPGCQVFIFDSAFSSFTGLSAFSTGTAPFTYQWSTGSTDQYILVTDKSKEYCVKVTDGNGCVDSACFIFKNNPPMSGCEAHIWYNDSTHMLEAKFNGKPASYSWNTGATTQAIHPDTAMEKLYCVQVVGDSGCVDSACFFFNPKPIPAGCHTFIADTSFGSQGIALYTYSTGKAPYTYKWSNGSTSEYIFIQDTTVKEYCVEITDADSCKSSECFYLGTKPPMSKCEAHIWYNDSTHMLEAKFNGKPASYLWNTGATTQAIHPDTAMGKLYCVKIVGDSGCVDSVCFFYTPNKPLPNCMVHIGVNDSTYMLEAVSTGVAPFKYMWNNGSTNRSIQFDMSKPATYCVKVMDNTGCVDSVCFFFEPKKPMCRVKILYDDSAKRLVAYSTGVAPFKYYWHTGSVARMLIPKLDQPRTYCVKVVDANGCADSACFDTKPLIPLVCNVNIIFSDSSMKAYAVSNGIPPFKYMWDDGSTQQFRTISDTTASKNCVTVTDSRGCSNHICRVYSPVGPSIVCPAEAKIRETVDFICMDQIGSERKVVLVDKYSGVNVGSMYKWYYKGANTNNKFVLVARGVNKRAYIAKFPGLYFMRVLNPNCESNLTSARVRLNRKDCSSTLKLAAFDDFSTDAYSKEEEAELVTLSESLEEVTDLDNLYNESVITNLYPNPTSDVVKIQTSYDDKVSVVISDVLGSVVKVSSQFLGSTQVDMTEQAKGVYFYQVKSESGEMISTGRFTKE